MKVAELIGNRLDYWVARASNWSDVAADSIVDRTQSISGWSPSTDWRIAGPIIERNGLAVFRDETIDFAYVGSEKDKVHAEGELLKTEYRHVPKCLGPEVLRFYRIWRAGTEIGMTDGYDPWLDVVCEQVGPTPLVAVMRAFVASKFGDEVPDE